MKIWCETCKGKGSYKDVDDRNWHYTATCGCCNGRGYTEDTETERLVDIAKALIHVSDCEILWEFADEDYDGRAKGIYDLDAMVRWAKGVK